MTNHVGLSFQDEDDTYDCEIDLDELLDLDEERERWMFVQASTNLQNKCTVEPCHTVTSLVRSPQHYGHSCYQGYVPN